MPAGSDIDTRADLVDAYALLQADQRPARIDLCNWIVRSGLIPHPIQRATKSALSCPFSMTSMHLGDCSFACVPCARMLARLLLLTVLLTLNASVYARNSEAIFLQTEANRVRQLRAAANIATKNILWFLHADSSPPADAVKVIRQHLQQTFDSGYFRFRFDGPRRWYKSWLEHAINFRASIGTPYGDQGLFASRQAYFAAGGHAATPLLEEVALVKKFGAPQAADQWQQA